MNCVQSTLSSKITPMKSQESIALEEVTKAVKHGRAAFLVGAGISANRQSWVPLWSDFVSSLLEAIAGAEGKHEVQYIKPHMGLLFNEVILHQMVQVIGLNNTAKAIKICMDINSYSVSHMFLAWVMKKFRNAVLTTNYDELIEEAAGWKHGGNPAISLKEPLKDSLLKLHGTLTDVTHARFTINQIFAPLEADLKRRMVDILRNRIVVVAGYRGADKFDVIPVLFEEANPQDIIWLIRNDIDPDVKKQLDDKHYKPIKVDVDDFFRKIYLNIARGESDPELDDWQTDVPVKERDWWKRGLQRWGINLWQHHRNEMRLLWARILDYLRIYQVYEGDIRHELAKSAYERFLSESSDVIANLEIEARLAYISRTMGTGAPQESSKVVRNIETMLAQTRGRDLRQRLQKLLGWALHEYGVTLQNAGDYVRAKAVLEESARLRTLTDDPELPYTLFQEFMNATGAAENLGSRIDDFAPVGWRSWLPKELVKYGDKFRETSEPAHYSQTLHNVAFVRQFLAEEATDLSNFAKAEREFGIALKTYREAMIIREQLRDPRMIAQSEVRIAQCNLGLARLACKRCNDDTAKRLVSEAKELAGNVKRIYEQIPQERFRLDHVEQIYKSAQYFEEGLKKSCLLK
jgi:tetratricopeptide (TPR) repeat protein